MFIKKNVQSKQYSYGHDRRTFLSVFVVVLIFFTFTSCIFRNNVRYYLKDNIQFSAPLGTGEENIYDSLKIGTPEKPYYISTPKFVFSINGKIVNSNEINIDEFKKLSGVKSTSKYIGDEWPKNTIHYYYSGYGILVNNNKILKFYAVNLGNLSKEIPTIGLSSDKLHPLPLSERSVKEIFGKEDKFHDFFMH